MRNYRTTSYFPSHSITHSCVLFFYIHTFFFVWHCCKRAEGQEMLVEREEAVVAEGKKNNPQSFRGPVIGFSFADAWEHSHLCTHNDDENHLTNCVP